MPRFIPLALASVIALGAAAAVAQTPAAPAAPAEPRVERGDRGDRAQRMEERRNRMNARMEERFNRRIERLKSDLALNDQQKPLWDRVETTIRKQMTDRRAERQANMERFRAAEWPQRLDLMTERATRQAATTKELSDAVKPLWASLSDPQKALVRNALPGGRERGMRGEGRRGEMQHGRGGHRG